VDIVTFLTTQWNALVANPSAFLACASISAGIGFAVAKLFYSTQAEVAKARLEAARDDLARLEKDRAERDKELAHVKSEVSALRSDFDRGPRITVGPRPPVNPREGDLFVEVEGSSVEQVPGAELFARPPAGSLVEVTTSARKTGRPIFLVIFDPSHPTRSRLAFTLGYFLEYETTRKLVAEHFESAVVPASDTDARALIPPNDPLERPRWVVMTADGKPIRSEGLYANPDEGLKRTREVIAIVESKQ
jgi:hypothetical protein